MSLQTPKLILGSSAKFIKNLMNFSLNLSTSVIDQIFKL